MELDVVDAPRNLEKTEFLLTELRFEGATASGQTIQFVDATFRNAAFTIMRWTTNEAKWPASERINTPIYLNCTRTNLLTTVDFKAKEGMVQHQFNSRGVGIMCSALQ